MPEEPAETPAPSETPVVTAPPPPEVTPEPEPEPPGINPLTGLPIEEEFENRRPIAVIMNNMRAALPMYGIAQADIIYEVPIEGGITRMLAFFQDLTVAPEIGTVRSARLYFIDIAQAHNAILIHCGGSPQAYNAISSRNMAALDALRGYEHRMFWRDADLRRQVGLEHSLFLTSEKAETVLETVRFPIHHPEGYAHTLDFTDTAETAGGQAAAEVISHIPGSHASVFNYNDDDSLYYFSQRDMPFMDGNTDTQVAVRNLLILRTDINLISGDTAGRLTIRTTGSGSGFYACDGKIIPIRWSKERHDAPYIYTHEDGTPLSLAKGRTYICIVTNRSAVTADGVRL
jgi:uncharacterized protein Usg